METSPRYRFVHKFSEKLTRGAVRLDSSGGLAAATAMHYVSNYINAYTSKKISWSKKSHEIQFPRGRETWHPRQSFPKIYFTIAVKTGSGKFFSFRRTFEVAFPSRISSPYFRIHFAKTEFHERSPVEQKNVRPFSSCTQIRGTVRL